MKIGLLGKLPKGDGARTSFVDWKTGYVKAITTQISDAKILHGDHVGDEIGPELIVGHDLWVVKNSDVLIVDGREKIGAGTAQEIILAKYFKKPVISIIPKDSHHRRSNIIFNGVNIPDWIHPFLLVSSDYVAEDINEAVAWLTKELATHQVKGMRVFSDSISLFEDEMPDTKAKYIEQGW